MDYKNGWHDNGTNPPVIYAGGINAKSWFFKEMIFEGKALTILNTGMDAAFKTSKINEKPRSGREAGPSNF